VNFASSVTIYMTYQYNIYVIILRIDNNRRTHLHPEFNCKSKIHNIINLNIYKKEHEVTKIIIKAYT